MIVKLRIEETISFVSIVNGGFNNVTKPNKIGGIDQKVFNWFVVIINSSELLKFATAIIASPIITEINRNDPSETIMINCNAFVDGGGENLGTCKNDNACINKEDFCLEISEHDLYEEAEH